MEFGYLTPSQIAAELGVSNVLTRAHLEALEEADILTHSESRENSLLQAQTVCEGDQRPY
jgi:predicted ArsR family transcriptional regulator